MNRTRWFNKTKFIIHNVTNITNKTLWVYRTKYVNKTNDIQVNNYSRYNKSNNETSNSDSVPTMNMYQFWIMVIIAWVVGFFCGGTAYHTLSGYISAYLECFNCVQSIDLPENPRSRSPERNKRVELRDRRVETLRKRSLSNSPKNKRVFV